jgi:hypothetical protein
MGRGLNVYFFEGVYFIWDAFVIEGLKNTDSTYEFTGLARLYAQGPVE